MFGAFAPHKAQQRAMGQLRQGAAAKAARLQSLLGQPSLQQQLQQAMMGPAQQMQQLLSQQAMGGQNNTTTVYINPQNHFYTASSSTSTTTGSAVGNWYTTSGSGSTEVVVRPPRVHDGQAVVIDLPDGSKLDVKADGSYEVIDKDARITYRANRMREFNPFLNASDKLEEFIRFCGQHKLNKDEMMDMPIRLFIAWLVQEAAQADQEPSPPEVNLLPDLRARRSPRCGGCGRFLRRTLVKQKIEFCAPVCFDRHYRRQVAA